MYQKQLNKIDGRWMAGKGERGGLTIFTAVLVLILMTLLLVYATRVSLFETRVSGNDMRQKEAFHVAEAALDQSVMYLLQNSSLVLSARVDAFRDGTGFSRDGWFAAGAERWLSCVGVTDPDHPCGDVAATILTNSFYYDTDGDGSTRESLPVNTTDFPTGTTARMSALLCFVADPTNPTDPCSTTAPATPEEERDSTLVLTLLAYGYSDCADTTDVASCTGEATVALPISNFRKLSGSPAVPLVSKSEVPITGTVEIVGNPNGGGLGVPLTTWVDGNQAKVASGCNGDAISAVLSSGSWQTCEMQEWYHVEEYPVGVICSDNNCLCGPGGNDPNYFLSYRNNSTDCRLNIDIIEDFNFPPDLFEFYFDVPRHLYPQIKNSAQLVQPSECGTLGYQSSGLIWVDTGGGEKCNLTGSRDPDQNLVIGSPLAPVILVSAADETVLNGGVSIFGILYIFDDDPPGSGAILSANGGAAVYGAVIVDAQSDLGGEFQIIYNEAVLANATGISGLGSVNGGWRDFGLPDIAW